MVSGYAICIWVILGAFDMAIHMVWYGRLPMVNMNFWMTHLASNVVADFNGLELMTWLMY
jgi:hypothetical protein